MAVERKRGCGYRKAGGLYIMADAGGGEPCHKLPVPLAICPTCGGGVKQVRGYSWAQVAMLGPVCELDPFHCETCPTCQPSIIEGGRFGLLWVGQQHYRTPGAFLAEAQVMGFSKRVNSWPVGFEPGQTWLGFAHPTGARLPDEAGIMQPGPGLFHVARSVRMELVITPSLRGEAWVRKYEEQGAVLVEVPDDDPDHAPRIRHHARGEALRKLAGAVELPEVGGEE